MKKKSEYIEEKENISEEKLISRREFLTGLRKWSKAVIGGVAAAGALTFTENNATAGGGWVNRRGGWYNGWANGSARWANGGRRWLNGWGNGGTTWINGDNGGWINRRGGGGWLNGR